MSGPLQAVVSQVLDYLPRLGAGGALLLVAWVVAAVARRLLVRGLEASGLDERLSAEAGMKPISQSLGNVVYWLVILLVLPAVLGALQVQGILAPAQAMVGEILATLPNVLAATIIGLVGWGLAVIVRNLVTNLLAGAGADRVGENAGLGGTMPLSRLVGLVLYVLVLVPALIAALNALQIAAITAPATEMLNGVMQAIPNVFAAAVILVTAYLVSRLVANLVSEVLGGAGFDRLPAKIGISEALRGDTTPSELVGRVIVFFVMLFATVEAANRLGFVRMADLVSTFIQFGSAVLLGSVMIAVGFWLSTLAHEAIVRVYGDRSIAIANVARFAILGLVIAMGLRQMGLAEDIVNLAFGLTLGAVAVAVALSFGLGGREAAGRQMEHWLSRWRGEALPPRRPADLLRGDMLVERSSPCWDDHGQALNGAKETSEMARALKRAMATGAVVAVFAAGYVCGSVGGRSADAQVGELGGAVMKKAGESGGVLGSAAKLGTAITDMQQEVDGLQKNLQLLKEIKSALGG
jgi:hypothetical protein